MSMAHRSRGGDSWIPCTARTTSSGTSTDGAVRSSGSAVIRRLRWSVTSRPARSSSSAARSGGGAADPPRSDAIAPMSSSASA